MEMDIGKMVRRHMEFLMSISGMTAPTADMANTRARSIGMAGLRIRTAAQDPQAICVFPVIVSAGTAGYICGNMFVLVEQTSMVLSSSFH